MSHEPLFYEDEYEAQQLMISLCSKDFKQCAAFLWPHMKIESAVARLRTCISRDGDQNLTYGQVNALMNFTGRYDPLLYSCDDTMHARPARKSPEDTKVALLSEFRKVSSQLQTLARELERSGGLNAD